MKKILLLGLLAFATLLVSCDQNEIVNQEETKTFEPYFLPLPDFVYEGFFDTLVYDPHMPENKRVGQLKVQMQQVKNVDSLMIAVLYFEALEAYQNVVCDYAGYGLVCNMPMDKKGNLVEGVYLASLGENDLYAIFAGSLSYADDVNGKLEDFANEPLTTETCFKIEREGNYYTIQFWFAFENGARHYVVFKRCLPKVDIPIRLIGEGW